jgi:hypothetical protein
VRVAGRRAPHMFSYVDEAVGTLDLHLTRKDRHGVADNFIGLETAPALYWTRRCEPYFGADPQIAIGGAIGIAGGDAIRKCMSCCTTRRDGKIFHRRG